ncbi:MAG TPA: phage baseplate assembly protein V, partial [Flavisolibacter sp.]|nr:phage baseplate assembly protein V [Flavisolibacter sp.]
PDAGGGTEGAKNRGMVVVPEVGDQVLLCFRYNDPDRPFVLGSMFHGKTGAGGGDTNKSKSITTRTGSTLIFDEGVRSILLQTDPTNNLKIEKTGDKISITAATEIKFTTGASSITMNKDGTISIVGVNLEIIGTKDGPASGIAIDPENVSVAANTDVTVGAKKIIGISGQTEINMGTPVMKIAGETTNVSGNKITMNGDGDVVITGGLIKINS